MTKKINNNADSETTVEKHGPGRPKGSKSGPRKVSFITVLHSKNLVEHWHSDSGMTTEEIKKNFTADFVTNKFIAKHGSAPDAVEGPVYFTNVPKKVTKEISSGTVTISSNALDDLDFLLGEATYDNWKGQAFSLTNMPNQVLFLFREDLGDNPRIKPQAQKIAKDLVIFS